MEERKILKKNKKRETVRLERGVVSRPERMLIRCAAFDESKHRQRWGSGLETATPRRRKKHISRGWKFQELIGAWLSC